MVASKYAKRDLMQSEFTERANAVAAHGLGLSVDVYSPDLLHLVQSLRDEGLQPGYLEVFKATTSAMQWVRGAPAGDAAALSWRRSVGHTA
jgi:hypothetical protein